MLRVGGGAGAAAHAAVVGDGEGDHGRMTLMKGAGKCGVLVQPEIVLAQPRASCPGSALLWSWSKLVLTPLSPRDLLGARPELSLEQGLPCCGGVGPSVPALAKGKIRKKGSKKGCRWRDPEVVILCGLSQLPFRRGHQFHCGQDRDED